LQRKNSIVIDITILDRRKLELTRFHNGTDISIDETNLDRALSLIEISQEKGIVLIFIVPEIVINPSLNRPCKGNSKKNI
jgi:hypothetical protein